MKLNNKQLLKLIWINQLRLLARGVIHKYVGGGVGLCPNDSFSFEYASSFHRVCRAQITSHICSQHLLKRIKKLVDDGSLKETTKDCTYMIHNSKALMAFWFARNYWAELGVPEGFGMSESGISFCKTAVIQDFDDKRKALESILIENFDDCYPLDIERGEE